jgi:trypsin
MLIKVLVLFSYFWFLRLVGSTNELDDKSALDSKIVGGEISPIHYIYQVSLQIASSGIGLFARNSSHTCGGSILSETHFLTAAHCVDGTPAAKLSALVGTPNLKDIRRGSFHAVDYCLVHPKYIILNTSDIALCKVKTPFKFGTNVGKIDFDKSYIGGNTKALLTGWGSVAQIRWLPIPFYSFFAYPDNLMRAIMPTISAEECSKTYTLDDTQLCTFARVGKGACAG